jgi:hypothetical protein
MLRPRLKALLIQNSILYWGKIATQLKTNLRVKPEYFKIDKPGAMHPCTIDFMFSARRLTSGLNDGDVTEALITSALLSAK